MLKTYIKYLGIDFGSSSVSIVGYEDKDTEPILFYDPEMKDTWFATAMTSDAQTFFQRSFTENDVLDSLKEDIIDGKNPANVKRFMEELLSTISQCQDSSTSYDFSCLERICFGFPTYTPTCTKAYCEKVTEIILEACTKVFNKADVQIMCLPEPELAARAYNEAHKKLDSYKNSVSDGDLILILDLGGYTLDMAILKANKDLEDNVRVRPLTNSESIESERMQISMGKRITRDICFQIYKDSTGGFCPTFDYGIEEQKCKFFSQGEKDTKPTRLKVTSKMLPNTSFTKFVLTKDQRGNSLTNTNGDNTITVGIYSSIDGRTIDIGRSYVYCGDLINNYISINLHNNRFGSKKISHVIFTGGTSRIDELRETIKNKLCSNEFVDSDVKMLLVDDSDKNALKLKRANDAEYEKLSSSNVVALGAAAVAMQADEITNIEDEFISGANADSDKMKCALLIKRNAVLERMIVNFFERGDLCEKCHAEFAKLLDDMEYPC